MTTKSEQLQIRVTPSQKAALKRLAGAAGLDVSSYVLSRALPEPRLLFEAIVRSLSERENHRFALAALNDLLTQMTPAQLREAVGSAPPALSPFLANYVAAMVEQACSERRVPAPSWVEAVAPLETPHFATSLTGLRLHLLRAAPVAFKRRNLFVDAALGDRV